jgi:hypothetical protein
VIMSDRKKFLKFYPFVRENAKPGDLIVFDSGMGFEVLKKRPNPGAGLSIDENGKLFTTFASNPVYSNHLILNPNPVLVLNFGRIVERSSNLLPAAKMEGRAVMLAKEEFE